MKLENLEKSVELKRRRDEVLGKREAALAVNVFRIESSVTQETIERASRHGVALNANLHAAIVSALRAYYDGLLAAIDGELATYGVRFASEDTPQ